MSAPPTFFLSYARGDTEEGRKDKIAQFFTDLRGKVARLVGEDPHTSSLGVLDTESKQSQDWKRRLSAALMTHHVFVAMLSPLYFKRDNCGRELAAFLRRYPSPLVDPQGSLVNAENILPILWMGERAFKVNGESIMPQLLRSVEWRPESGGDPELSDAVDRYLRRGMEGCVKPGRQYYDLLVQSIAERIRDLPNLPASSQEPDLVNGDNAYTAEWLKPLVPVPAVATQAVEPPSGPETLVALHVTSTELLQDPRPVRFADTLVSEVNAAGGPAWLSNVANAVHLAGIDEKLSVYQGASRPDGPNDPPPSRLLRRLRDLSQRNIVTVLIIDPSLWPARGAPVQLAPVLLDTDWIGTPAVPLPVNDRSRLQASIEQWNTGEGRKRLSPRCPRTRRLCSCACGHSSSPTAAAFSNPAHRRSR
jgi:hypothetical protein